MFNRDGAEELADTGKHDNGTERLASAHGFVQINQVLEARWATVNWREHKQPGAKQTNINLIIMKCNKFPRVADCTFLLSFDCQQTKNLD